MSEPNPVLTTIIFVFGVQALVLCALLLLKRPRRQANSFLALLVFFFSLMALNIALVNVLSSYGRFAIFRYVQLELLYGIGPALYFYSRSITDRDFRFRRKHLIHFLPVVLEFIFYRTPIYRLGADGMYQTPAHPYTPIYLAEQWLGILSISVYTVVSLRILYYYQKWLRQHYSHLEHRSLQWLRFPVIFYAAFWIAWNLLTEFDRLAFDRALKELYFLPAFVGLAAVSYWIGLQGYVKSFNSVSGYSQRKSQGEDATYNPVLVEKLEKTMEEQRPYLDPELDLGKLSELVEANPRQVSQAINSGVSKNFYEFVNGYRVEAFKARVQDPESNRLTLLALALECGFRSKSTFNDAFKKATGKTPSAYTKSLKKRPDGSSRSPGSE